MNCAEVVRKLHDTENRSPEERVSSRTVELGVLKVCFPDEPKNYSIQFEPTRTFDSYLLVGS